MVIGKDEEPWNERSDGIKVWFEEVPIVTQW